MRHLKDRLNAIPAGESLERFFTKVCVTEIPRSTPLSHISTLQV